MIEYPVTVATRGGAVETTVTASVLATADAVIDKARREVGIAPAAFARGTIGHDGDTAGPARAVADGGHPTRPVRVPVEASSGECWHVPGGCAGHHVETIAATATELVDERGLRPCQANGCQAAGIEAPVRCDGCGVAVFDPDERGAARYCPDCRAYVDAHPDERDHEVYALREPDAPVPVTDGGQPDGETDQFNLEGTSRLNASGSTGSGTLTLPKHVTEPLLAEHGKDFAVFSDGDRVLLVPQSEVSTDV